MTDRRNILLTMIGAGLAATALHPRHAWSQSAERASAFIKTTGDRLVAIINGAGSAEEKQTQIGKVILAAVDVAAVGRFCLGRFWRQASPEQQKAYLTLFQDVLISSISAKLGEYQGVRFTLGRTRAQDQDEVVSTLVERPNNAPATVEWIVTQPVAAPKIIDVVAEGTSLRITQRSDYASYLQRNNNSIDALIAAMRKQITQSQ